jgi:hypothetical protein
MFFGTISPITMWATTTTASEIVKASGSRTSIGSPSQVKGTSMRCATAGSPRRPNSTEQIVMPSWDAASIRERSAPARNAVDAPAVPAWAIASSRSRRAETSANSAPTKKALISSRRMAAARARKSLLTDGLHNGCGEAELGHTVAVAPHHREAPPADLHVVADVGDAAQA